ncbi:MAG: DUF5676 family membrane protein [Parvibaculum sp.]|nr:DUF5676 family membrane protein [Parvibaculum sp.]
MNKTGHIAIVPLGMSISSFFVITYVLCVLFGLLVSSQGMHQLLSTLLPGFTWLTWPSFLLGLVWMFGLGWYIAVIFAPIYNFFVARGEKSGNT